MRGPEELSTHNRTLLHALDDKPGWYAPWHTHTPRQYGYSLIDVVADAGAKRLSVELAGLAEEGQRTAWRATLGLTIGKQTQTLTAKALPAKTWVRVTLMLGPAGAQLFLDGKPLAQDAEQTLSPADLKAVAGYLGRGWRSGAAFAGKIERISLYRTAFTRMEDMPAAP